MERENLITKEDLIEMQVEGVMRGIVKDENLCLVRELLTKHFNSEGNNLLTKDFNSEENKIENKKIEIVFRIDVDKNDFREEVRECIEDNLGVEIVEIN